MDTTALLHAAADGDTAAWDALVERYNGLVWAVVRGYRLSPHDAADATQTTWLRLVEKLGDIRNPEGLGAWLATTARHECLRIQRIGQRHVLTDGFDLPDEDALSALDAGLLTRERDSALWRAFAKLGARCQALLRLLIADPPPSYDEISAALDMPVGSIGPTRGRCLERLRENVAATGITTASGSS
jgi:RNA polymerase sigma factor (sigma-70 family)